MTYYTSSELFYINSRNRETGTDSDFTFKLNLDPNHEYDKIAVLDCSVPKSYYIVRDGYNTFTLDENGDTATITVPVGNYNRNSLKTKIQTLLNSDSPNNYTYVVSTNNIQQTQDNGKYTFTVSNNAGVQPSFIFGEDFYEALGFSANSTNVFVADTLSSTNVLNLNSESTLFLRSNICHQTSNNILQNIITTNDSSFSYITFVNPHIQEYSKNFSRNRTNVYSFQLTDEDGNAIDLNGLNLVFTLMLYKSNKIDDMIKQYIKLKILDQQTN